MRVTTAFNRMLGLPGAWVDSVSFEDTGVVVGIKARGRRLRCPCGYSTSARYDSSRRRWRHLDLGASSLWLEADIRRLACRPCGRVRTEEVAWARPGARHTRDFEDVVAWLAQRMDKTGVATLLRCSWEAVDRIVRRVVVDHLDETRLDGLYHLGVDEISYKRGHQYVTVVADHDSGRVVWVAPGKSRASLASFYEALGPERRAQIRAVSMDLGAAYRGVTADTIPHAAICLDPFHVIQLVQRALDSVYRASRYGSDGSVSGKEWRRAQTALRKGAERLSPGQRELLERVSRTRHDIGLAWELKEWARDLYRTIDPVDARHELAAWIDAARTSKLPAFMALARQLHNHFDGIVAAIHLGLSNSRLEGINAKIRLINRRGYGHHSAAALASMIYLCIGGITIELPTQR